MGTTFSDMDADNWLILAFFKIELWNFQDKLDLWFREASQNLSLFRQLFFSLFPRGDQRKNAEKPMYSFGNFSAFFLWSPLGNYEKKSCLNKLKFWEASRNQKRSICWKFQLSNSLGTQKGTGAIGAGPTMIKPFMQGVSSCDFSLFRLFLELCMGYLCMYLSLCTFQVILILVLNYEHT